MNAYYLYCPNKQCNETEAYNKILGMFVDLQEVRYVGVNTKREHVFFIKTPVTMKTERLLEFNNSKKGRSYLYISKKYDA